MKFRNPKGSRDWLPDEVEKQEFVRKSLVSVFEKWGYKPVQTPILINRETLTLGSNNLLDKAFKLTGEHGENLALRADLTTPIARLTAERLRDEDLPFRFYYVGKVFRYQARKTTNERELYQIGIELIGANEGLSDLECLKILNDSIKKLGIKKYLIVINHTGFWHELLKKIGKNAEELYKALSKKDLVRYFSVLEKSRLSSEEKKFLSEIINIRGGKKALEKLKLISKKVKKINLKNIISYFQDILNVFDSSVEIDLSLTNDMGYYTGIYFEIITESIGRNIGAGGRYDELIGKFGFSTPAIGFSFCLEDILLSLEKQGKPFPTLSSAKYISATKKNIKNVFKKIEAMQKNNIATIKL